MRLCPFCLQTVQRFREAARQDGRRGYDCPQCNEAVPLRYVQEYDRYPPVVLSLVGLPGHGKTVYLSSLLYALNRFTTQCPEFSYAPLDEEGMSVVREKQRALEEGHLPQSTRKVFPRPVILRLENVPRLGSWHLLVYDMAGEVFQQVSQLTQYAGYVVRSRVVVWLVSLRDVQHPSELEDFLTRYVQGLLEIGGNPKEQTLFVVLTKGDELVAQEVVPEIIREFLTKKHAEAILEEVGDAGRTVPAVGLSQAIEAWLEHRRGYTNFVRRARQEFRRVEYSVVSALGSAPRGQEQLVTVVPRGVVGVLLRLLQWEWERVEAERRRQEEERRWQEQALRPLRSLSPANPWHWLVLLWWALVRPQVLQARKQLDDAERARLRAVGNWLSSTLLWGPLLMAWGWVAIHRQQLLTLPAVKKDAVLPSLLGFWEWLFIPVAVGWVLAALAENWLEAEKGVLMAFGVALLVAGGVVGGVAGILAAEAALPLAACKVFLMAFGVAFLLAGGVVMGMAMDSGSEKELGVADNAASGVVLLVLLGLAVAAGVVVGLGAGLVASSATTLFAFGVGGPVEKSIRTGTHSWIARTAFVALVASWAVMLWQLAAALVKM